MTNNNADFIIGYGKGYKENTKLNLFKTNKNANYLGGSSKTILNIIKLNLITILKNLNLYISQLLFLEFLKGMDLQRYA